MGILFIFGDPLLNPIIAAVAMSFSLVLVLLNALRLKGLKPAVLEATVEVSDADIKAAIDDAGYDVADIETL